MIRIADILELKGDQVLTVTADTPVARVAERMRSHASAPSSCHADGVHVEGLVTERDIVDGLSAQGAAIVDAPVSTVMTHPGAHLRAPRLRSSACSASSPGCASGTYPSSNTTASAGWSASATSSRRSSRTTCTPRDADRPHSAAFRRSHRPG